MGGYGQWQHDSLIGLQQGDGVAYARMRVRPEVVSSPRLRSAAARYALPRGEAAVAWARGALCGGALPGAASFELNVTVPPNSMANVTVPLSGCGGAPAVTESGAPVWPPPASLPAGVHGARADALSDGLRAATFEVGSGTFAFRAAPP